MVRFLDRGGFHVTMLYETCGYSYPPVVRLNVLIADGIKQVF